MNQKGLTTMNIILGLVVLAIIGSGLYYLGTQKNNISQNSVVQSPSSTSQPIPSAGGDQTANWKAYTSQNLGISFKYPSDKYKIESETKDTISISSIFEPGHQTIPGFITISTNLSKDLPDCTKITYNPQNPMLCYNNITQTTLGGLPATSYDLSKGEGSYILIQVLQTHPLEVKQHVVGGGEPATFNPFIASFKFN